MTSLASANRMPSLLLISHENGSENLKTYGVKKVRRQTTMKFSFIVSLVFVIFFHGVAKVDSRIHNGKLLFCLIVLFLCCVRFRCRQKFMFIVFVVYLREVASLLHGCVFFFSCKCIFLKWV